MLRFFRLFRGSCDKHFLGEDRCIQPGIQTIPVSGQVPHLKGFKQLIIDMIRPKERIQERIEAVVAHPQPDVIKEIPDPVILASPGSHTTVRMLFLTC